MRSPSHLSERSLFFSPKTSAMTKSNLCLLLAALATLFAVQVASAFVPQAEKRRRGLQPLYEYVPDGMDPAKWRKLKENERNAKANKNYGAFGPSSFKSRSLQAFQKDLEKGKVGLCSPCCCLTFHDSLPVSLDCTCHLHRPLICCPFLMPRKC